MTVNVHRPVDENSANKCETLNGKSHSDIWNVGTLKIDNVSWMFGHCSIFEWWKRFSPWHSFVQREIWTKCHSLLVRRTKDTLFVCVFDIIVDTNQTNYVKMDAKCSWEESLELKIMEYVFDAFFMKIGTREQTTCTKNKKQLEQMNFYYEQTN